MERAPMFHAYWVCLLLQEWITLMESNLDPKDWVGDQ